MDPVVTKAVTSLTSSLAKALCHSAGRLATNAVVGKPDQRALDEAYQAAVEGAVRELATEGMTDAELADALALSSGWWRPSRRTACRSSKPTRQRCLYWSDSGGGCVGRRTGSDDIHDQF